MFLGQTSFSQTNRISIYKTLLAGATDSTVKLDAYLNLCDQEFSLNTDSLYEYAMLAKKLATELKDNQKKILANVAIETWLERKNLFDSALTMANNDLKHLNYDHDAEVYSKVMMQKCYALMKNNRQKEALTETYFFLTQAEEQGDITSQIFSKLLIGVVYRNMGQTELAWKWFRQADNTVTDSAWEEKKNQFGTYFLLGMMYNWRADADSDPQKYIADSTMSVQYLDRSIKDSRYYENLAILARSLNVKASAIGSPQNVALEGSYVMEAKRIYESLHDTLSMLNTISPLCFYYIDEGHPEKGIAACKDGLEMVRRGNSFPTFDLYEALAQCYKAEGNYEAYAETLRTIINLKDSVYKINSEHDLADLNAKYDDQKKQNTIIRQQLDIAAKRNSMYGFIILSGMLFFIIVFLYRYDNKMRKKQKEKEVVAIAAAEEAERKRISADLHDNIGAYAAAAASSLLTLEPESLKDRNILAMLKGNMQEMITQLNDSIWALNKKSLPLTNIGDRFKLFVQKLEFAYPQIVISIEENITSDISLSPFQALHLYRTMQEALNNALKHSRCSNVIVNITSSETLLEISIADDGIGIRNMNGNGNGINNLKMRAKESGWNTSWEDNPCGGTRVIISSASG
jgi:signal transduction histidine kinase